MRIQEQINKLSEQIARINAFNYGEFSSEKIQRTDETTQIQSDIIESVVDRYNAIIGG